MKQVMVGLMVVFGLSACGDPRVDITSSFDGELWDISICGNSRAYMDTGDTWETSCIEGTYQVYFRFLNGGSLCNTADSFLVMEDTSIVLANETIVSCP